MGFVVLEEPLRIDFVNARMRLEPTEPYIMKKLRHVIVLLLTIVLLNIHGLKAQSFQLSPTLQWQDGLSLKSMVNVSNGVYLVGGNYRPFGSISDQGIVAMINTGALAPVWVKTFEPYSRVLAVKRTSNGDCLVSGLYANYYDAFVCRIDQAGNVIWRTNIATPLLEWFNDVIESPDGNIWACGGANNQKELLAIFTATGSVVSLRQPSSGNTGSWMQKMFVDGSSIVIFGQEFYGSTEQLSVRRFNLSGVETYHLIFGSNFVGNESLCDVAILPAGAGYAVLTQYYTGQHQLGILRISNALTLMSLTTSKAYRISGNNLVSGKIVADGSYLYLFATYNPGVSVYPANTVMTRIQITSPLTFATIAIARGYVRVSPVLDNGSIIGVSSANATFSGSYPEYVAEFSKVETSTFTTTGLSCFPPASPPSVSAIAYFGSLGSVSLTPGSWANLAYASSVPSPTSSTTLMLFDCGSVLPVRLVEFRGDVIGEKVKLSWTTLTETNNDRFEIERSNDAVNFEFVKSVIGGGSSSTASFYEAWDDHPYFGESYYRLAQFDYDGNVTYSDVVPIFIHPDGERIELFNISGQKVYEGLRSSIPTDFAEGLYIMKNMDSKRSSRIWIPHLR